MSSNVKRLQNIILIMGVLLRLHSKARQRIEHTKMEVAATKLQMFCRRWFLRRKITLKKERRELYQTKPEQVQKEPTRQEKVADALGQQVHALLKDKKVVQHHPLLGKCTKVVDDVSFFGEEKIIGEVHLFEGMILGGRLIMVLQDQSSGRSEAGVCYVGYKEKQRLVKAEHAEPTLRKWNLIFVGITRRDHRSGRVSTTQMPATSVTSPKQSALVGDEMKSIVKEELRLFIAKMTPPVKPPVKPLSRSVKKEKSVKISASGKTQPSARKTGEKTAAKDQKPRRPNHYVQFNIGIQAYLTGLTFNERTKRVSEVLQTFQTYLLAVAFLAG